MSLPSDDELVRVLTVELVTPPLAPAFDAELAALVPIATRRPLRELAIVIVVNALVIVAFLAVLGTRADLRELAPGWIPCVAVAWAAGIFAASWSALVPRRGSMMPRWRPALAMVIVSSCAFVVLGLLIHPAGPSSLHYGWERLAHGHPCLELGLAVAGVPIVVAAWCLRGSAPTRARVIAATVGAGSGCAGGLLLHFYCKIADGAHIGIVHGGVVVCAALIARLVVPRIIVTRS